MANTATKVSKSNPAIRAILAATFTQYKGRKVRVVLTDRLPVGFCSGWSEGSRTLVKMYNLATGVVVHVQDDSRDCSVASAHWIIVEHSHYCGEDAGITIRAKQCLTPDVVDVVADALYAGDKVEAQITAAFDSGSEWGSYDRGHEHVTALDLAWSVIEAVSAQRKTSDRKAAA
jgi:hypothetical protein